MLTAGEARANLAAVAAPQVRVDGNAGGGMRRMGFWAGGMSAAGVGLGPAPLVNIWNPAGWVIAPAMAAGSLAYVGGRLLSRFGLGQGAKRREAARVESRQAAHRAVRAYFADVGARVIYHGERRITPCSWMRLALGRGGAVRAADLGGRGPGLRSPPVRGRGAVG